MAIVFESNNSNFIKTGNSEVRSRYDNKNCWGSSWYVKSAEITDEGKQYVYSLGLVPALLMKGSYHENFPTLVGVLPEYVNKLKQLSDDYELYFNCFWEEN